MSPGACAAALALLLGSCTGAHLGISKAEDTTVNLAILSGQSNAQGQGDPAGVETIDAYRVQGEATSLVGPVQPDLLVGPEIEIYRELGKAVVVAKSAHNGASANMFFRGTSFGTSLRNTRTNALALVPKAYPGRTITTVFIWIQGEAEAGAITTANAYEADLRQLLTELDADWGTIPTHIVLVNSGFTTLPYRSIVRTAQIKVAGEAVHRHTIDPDAITDHDGLHYNTAGQTALGALIRAAAIP